MSEVSTPCPQDSELMKAWDKYKKTTDYKNSKEWALRLAPFFQAGTHEENETSLDILSLERRKRHVEGSLWAAFMAGFEAAGGKVSF